MIQRESQRERGTAEGNQDASIRLPEAVESSKRSAILIYMVLVDDRQKIAGMNDKSGMVYRFNSESMLFRRNPNFLRVNAKLRVSKGNRAVRLWVGLYAVFFSAV